MIVKEIYKAGKTWVEGSLDYEHEKAIWYDRAGKRIAVKISDDGSKVIFEDVE